MTDIPTSITARVLGGYLVLPTTGALRGVTRPTVRADAIRAARAMLLTALKELENLGVDTAVELNRTYNTPWQATASRLGISNQALMNRVHRRHPDLRRRYRTATHDAA